MRSQETTLESILAGGCIFLCGYILLIAALLADSPALLITGISIFSLSFLLIRKFDPVVRRGCATSGLLQILWIGLISACIFWNASFTVKLILLLISPAGAVIFAVATGIGDQMRKIRIHARGAYRQIKRQS